MRAKTADPATGKAGDDTAPPGRPAGGEGYPLRITSTAGLQAIHRRPGAV